MHSSDVDLQSRLLDWFRHRSPDVDIDLDANYYKAGLIDSFGIVELIDFAEAEFGVRFEDSDFKEPSFRTISGLVRLIERRRGVIHR